MSRLLVVVFILLSPAAAVAQSTFYEAYERGIDLQATGHHQEAREAFLAAAAIRPDPEKRVKTYGLNFLHDYDPYFHLAQVEIELGLLDDAQGHLDRSATAGVSPAEENDALQRALREALRDRRRAAAVMPTSAPASRSSTPQPRLTPRPTILKVVSEPVGAEVFVDGLLLGITPVSIPVEHGSRRVEVRLDGHETQTRTHAVRRGGADTLRFQLERVPVTPTRTPELKAAGESADAMPVMAPPSPSPTAFAAEASPVETPVQLPSDRFRYSIPAWVPTLLIVIGLGLLVWLTRFQRRRRRPGSTSPVLTDDTTIGLSGGIPLPDDAEQVFGDYTLKKVLGAGGMATTYLAERTRDGMQVALKVPHEHLLREPVFVERFFREGTLGATVHHPNIVRIREVGQVGNHPFIALELVPGETLAKRLKENGPLGMRPALEATRGIALALDYAHVKGIVHRDLKPANVMMLPDGSVKVMDFGIARIADAPDLTATNEFMGTPLFSAPEALTPTSVDHRSDLYSLGIILYTMLSGRPPFEADSPLRLLEMHRDDNLPPFRSRFEIPTRVEELIKRLTAKAKSDRFPSAEVLLAELNAILNEI